MEYLQSDFLWGVEVIFGFLKNGKAIFFLIVAFLKSIFGLLTLNRFTNCFLHWTSGGAKKITY